MKIIDILVKKANGTLEDKFEFEYSGIHFAYLKKVDEIQKIKDGKIIGCIFSLDECLNDEVEVIEENKEIEELQAKSDGPYTIIPDSYNMMDKINELVRAVNKLTKESK